MRDFKILYVVVLSLLYFACASPGTPSGGEKDEIPPRITGITPENYATNFDKKRIIIDFNEFVKLKDAAKNVMISPPQKKKPKIRLKERQIVVDIRDSLRENTTYTIDFGKAIVDNNEGNPLGEYRYVFTTGTRIDEMGLAGFVRGSKVDTVATGVTVALYTPSYMLNPYKSLPDYIAQTDSLGFFMFNNIVDREYKIIAFQDENSNNMLDEEEPLAFRKENIHTSITVDAEEKEDSLQLDQYTKFKNTNLLLRIFKPTTKQQYLKNYKRNSREKINFFFNAPREDSLELELLDVEKEVKFFIERSKNNDSLTYWIADKEISNRDTLTAQLSYLRTNSLGDLALDKDTVKLIYKKPKKKKKKKEKEESKEEPKFMEIKTNMSGKLNYFDDLTLTFELPVDSLKEEDISISTMKDTIEVPLKISLQKDSVLPFRKFRVLCDLKPEQKYTLKIDSMKVYDINGMPNKELKNSFETYETSYYGRIFATISGGEPGLWIQLTSKKKPDEVIIQKKWEEGGKITFENLPPDTYLMKALWDTNGNGEWDTGDYETQRQPEKTAIFKKEIKLPSNWDLEVAWTLKKEK